MFVWLLHFKGFFLYALLFYIKNVGCGPLFMSVHPNIYYRTIKKFDPASNDAGSFSLYAGLPRIFSMTLYSGLYSVRVNTKFPAQWTRSKVMPLTQ